MPLNVGLYTLNIFASSRMIVEDWIKDAARFSVEPADFYGSGRIPDSNRLILLDHQWHLLMQGLACSFDSDD
jgi:hypothetical protein